MKSYRMIWIYQVNQKLDHPICMFTVMETCPKSSFPCHWPSRALLSCFQWCKRWWYLTVLQGMIIIMKWNLRKLSQILLFCKFPMWINFFTCLCTLFCILVHLWNFNVILISIWLCATKWPLCQMVNTKCKIKGSVESLTHTNLVSEGSFLQLYKGLDFLQWLLCALETGQIGEKDVDDAPLDP